MLLSENIISVFQREKIIRPIAFLLNVNLIRTISTKGLVKSGLLFSCEGQIKQAVGLFG